MSLDADSCYRALCARDPRFDGLFFVAVSTTGIYCRPVCRARRPGRDRCTFYRTAAEAERAGFRACFRCRPELSPGSSASDARPALVARALGMIESGFLDDHSIDDLATKLGVGARHLRRTLASEVGVGPIDLAQSRRLAFAKQLVVETSLPITEIAFASGFASVRRFNAAFVERHGKSPSALRRRSSRSELSVVLRLAYRPPFDFPALLSFLEARAIPGVEGVVDGEYRRTVRLGDATGWLSVTERPRSAELCVSASPGLARRLGNVVVRARRLFDLDAQPSLIAEHLAGDPRLAALVRRRPGLRVPGAFDGFEIAVRAILGQQVSVRAATTLSGRLSERFGTPIETPHADLRCIFPTPERLAAVGADQIAELGLPRARAGALSALAGAVARGELELEPGADPDSIRARLLALPGIGAWTADYVAMRVLGFPDAFPAGDLALRRALGNPDRKTLHASSERWRPWRAYAAMQLWTATGDPR